MQTPFLMQFRQNFRHCPQLPANNSPKIQNKLNLYIQVLIILQNQQTYQNLFKQIMISILFSQIFYEVGIMKQEINDNKQKSQQRIYIINLYISMDIESDLFNFNRKLNYANKDEDNLFVVKYVVNEKSKRKKSKGQLQISQPVSSSNTIVTQPQLKIIQQESKPENKNKKYKRVSKMDEEQLQQLKKYSKINLKNVKPATKQQKAKKYRQRQQKQEQRQIYVKGQDKKKKYRKKQKRDNQLRVPERTSMKRSKSIEPTFQRNPIFKNFNRFTNENKQKIIYEPYLPIEDIEISRAQGQKLYYKGIVDCDERLKWFVRINTKELEGYLVAEGGNRNRCLHGDEVYFTILPSQRQEKQKQSDKVHCKIVYITPHEKLKGKKRQIVGRIQLIGNKKIYVLTPINKRFVSFNIRLNDIDKKWLAERDKKYFLAQFSHWNQTQEYPVCTIVDIFGDFGSVEIETDALLITHSIYKDEYTQAQIQQGLGKFLKQTDHSGQYLINQQEIVKRTDLRQEYIFTIDPLTARDFDDALSIRELAQSQKNSQLQAQNKSLKIFEIGVHIADASFFVQQNGAIDQQAQIRTTSVYLVHRVLPMLPRVLCQTMCSLNPGLQRLTLSVWFKIDQNGKVFNNCRYDRTVIKSKARFTYEQAQDIIDGKIKSQGDIPIGFGCVNEKDYSKIANDIVIMNELAKKLRKTRIQLGSLIFQIPKKSYKLDEKNFPVSYEIKQRFQANFLVEEYMLLANQKVAQILVRGLGPYALLRKHKFPGQKKIKRFEQFMKKIGQQIKITKTMNVQDQINIITNKPELKQCVKDLIRYQMIFLLELAQYFLVGQTSKQQWIHYALKMGTYTHFTSPIRRYPDIIVHRQLISIIQAQKQGIKKPRIPNFSNIDTLIQRCNKNKMSAKKVSTECQKVFLCLYLKNNPVKTQAIITSVQQWGIRISVPKYDFRTTLEVKHLKNIKFQQKGKDSRQRQYIVLTYNINNEDNKFTLILKQLQTIDIRLQSTDTFPIDYKVRLMVPHPKNPKENLVMQ